jgi:lipooligosaccharide transport system permease protein
LTILIPNFVEPLLYLAALGLGLGAFIREGGIGGQSYPQYIAPGLLAANAMFAASFESTFNTFVKLKVDRVYEAIVSTPVNVEDAIAGEYLWAGTRAVMQGTVFLTVLTLLGLISSPWAILILFTSLIPTIDLYGYYFTLVITPLFLFSGIFFPIDGFPAPIPQIAWFTPLYHAVNACRELATGPSAAIFVDLGWMMFFTAALSLIPIYFMRRRLIN